MKCMFLTDARLSYIREGCWHNNSCFVSVKEGETIDIDHINKGEKVKRRHAEGGPYTWDSLHITPSNTTDTNYLLAPSWMYVVEEDN